MRPLVAIAALALLAALPACAETLVYRTTMSLYIPRVYANTESLGYRKFQRQSVRGWILVDKSALTESGEPSVTAALTNYTHRVQGERVTYTVTVDDESTMWRYIGSNATGVFKKPAVKFVLDCDPSYNIGADEPDNTLILTLSGRGNTDRAIRGSVAGQIGCGCHAYGHISPTRRVDGEVSDITPCYGTFTMRLSYTIED